MDFRIADTFTESLGRLTGAEQKAAKTTALCRGRIARTAAEFGAGDD